jgi:PAS domain S-box-containing protein
VLVTGWVSGLRPALVAWGLATLAFTYYFTPPFDSLTVNLAEVPRLVIFTLVAALMATVSAARRKAEDALKSARITDRKHAETALREQAGLLDLTHDTVFVRDMTDVITYWNRAAEEFYGWTAQDAVGKVSHHLTQTIFPAPIEDIQAELLRAGRWEGELVHTRADGSQAVVASRWSLQHDEHGQPLAILETNNDITNRKLAEAKLRESEQRYRYVFDATGVAICEEDFSEVKRAIDDLRSGGIRDFRNYFATHPDFVQHALTLVKVVDVNDVTVRLFAARDKDDFLASLHKVFVPETRKVFVEEMIAIAEGRTSYETETVLRRVNGERLTVRLTMTFPAPPARIDRVLVTHRGHHRAQAGGVSDRAGVRELPRYDGHRRKRLRVPTRQPCPRAGVGPATRDDRRDARR